MKRILVVDDTISILKQVEVQLSSKYDLMLAGSGNIALQLLQKKRPDLILLDIEMPDLNGFQVLERIKENPCLCSIPVIFHSSLTDPGIHVRALKAGARDFIAKPAVKDVLLNRIELHLQMAEYLNKMEGTVTALSGIMTKSFSELINFRYKMKGHSERVPKICAVLGWELVKRNLFAEELNPADLNLIIQASPLHDIGNITIPDRILLKPGPLTDEERNEMKKHSSQGATILEHFSLRIPTQRFFHYARLIAQNHHEAWDGGGYPAGLCSDAIPLCGRLVAVADVYDDITSDRVYRPPLSHLEACQAILKEKGRRFDPRIVEVFDTVKNEIRDLIAA